MITIIDGGQTLSAAQRDTLTAKANAYPFDLIVEIQTRYAVSRAAFEHDVADRVTPGSRIVAIGIDPRQHYTFVRSSAALGVPSGPQVAQAGNAFFRAGNLVDGIDAITAKANELRVEPVAPRPFVAGPDQRVVSSQTGVPIVIQENHTATGVWWGLGAFILAACAVVAYAVWRARKARLAARAAEEAAASEAAELAARNVEEASWHDAMAERRRSSRPEPTPAPAWGSGNHEQSASRIDRKTSPIKARYSSAPPAAPAPVVVVEHTQSSSLDLLVGYEIGRDSYRPAPAAPAPVIIEREVYVAPSPSYDSSSSDSSSSSSWSGSDDSSSSSSFDSGSGGGSDSSSGSDW